MIAPKDVQFWNKGVGSNERKVQSGSILAGELSFFWECDKMELMNQGDFIESLGGDA